MKKGGFDVIIGNPPYGVNFNDSEKRYLSNFDSHVPDYEIYIFFISLYKKILKANGLLSYIFPNTFLSTIFGKTYRDNLFNNVNIYQIIDLSADHTFSDASVRTCIVAFQNNSADYSVNLFNVNKGQFKFINSYNKSQILIETSNILGLFSQSQEEKLIIQKLKKCRPLKEFYEVSQGLIPYDKYRGHDEYTITNRIWHANHQKDETYKKELKGGDVNRYCIQWNGELWISYGEWLAAPRNKKYFTNERILVREITTDKLFCSYSDEEYYNTPSLINIINENNTLALKYSLTLLNSNLIGWLHNKVSPKANKGLFPKILINDIRIIPLAEISPEAQVPFIEKADLMLDLNKQLQEVIQKFQRLIMRKFELAELPKKLQDWYLLSYGDFIKELAKKKIKLSLKDESEWESHFMDESKQALAIKAQIDKTDQEIDVMVYALYGLSDDEIAIIEG